MNYKLGRIERLDWAARALAALPLFSWSGIFFIWYPLIKMWIWREPYYGRVAHGVPSSQLWAVILGAAVVPTLMVSLRHRYAILAIAFVDFLIGSLLALQGLPKYRLTPDWVYYLAFSPLWFCFGFLFFRTATRVARVYTLGWELERDQVEDWLRILQQNKKEDKVTEIQESTFIRGNRTYRILNAHDCWVMAVFKTGKEDGYPFDFRVREPAAIALLNEPGGPLRAVVDGRIITNSKK